MERTELLRMIDERHSVRSYLKKELEPETAEKIRREIARYNDLSGMHIQLVENAVGILGGFMTMFAGWKKPPAAYIAMVGRADDAGLEEKCGYYGEYLALFLQSLGLNTCWVGMFNKKAAKAEIAPGERLVIVIVAGYGEDQGIAHRSRLTEKLTDVKDMPDWFRKGVECALKAPTAVNQQKFFITLRDGAPVIETAGRGPFIKVDLGIVRCHFEAGSGRGEACRDTVCPYKQAVYGK